MHNIQESLVIVSLFPIYVNYEKQKIWDYTTLYRVFQGTLIDIGILSTSNIFYCHCD